MRPRVLVFPFPSAGWDPASPGCLVSLHSSESVVQGIFFVASEELELFRAPLRCSLVFAG